MGTGLRIRSLLFSAVLLACLPPVVLAAEDDESAMFSEDMVEESDETQETPPAVAPEEELLSRKGIEWGGSFTGEMTAAWAWLGQDYPDLAALPPAESSLSIDLSASLFLDARPTRDFRVFAKVKTEYPFSRALSGVPGTLIPEVSIFELFTDFSWKDAVYFRFGKHTIKWGTGYFFSPADVLNLKAIDPADPEVEREGPVSLRVHVPIGVNNLYGYVIANDITKPEDLAAAAKFELVVGGWELGVGGFFRQDLAPRAAVTASGSVWKIRFFGEAVGSWGSDRNFLTEQDPTPENPTGLITNQKDDRLFLKATAGASFTDSDAKLSLTAQYYFNGEGYESSHLRAMAFPFLLAGQAGVPGVPDPGFSMNDLSEFGMHYMAASILWSEIGGSPISPSAFWIGNISDGSGMAKLEVSVKLLDFMFISPWVSFIYGDGEDEYSLLLDPPYDVIGPGKGFTAGLTVILGNGKF